MSDKDPLHHRDSPARMEPGEFRALGHWLVDRLGEYLTTAPEQSVYPQVSTDTLRELLPAVPLPETGADPQALLGRAADLLCHHALQSSHARFWGYILGPHNLLGTLGDFLASTVNTPPGAHPPFTMAVAIELQVLRWLAELVGYPPGGGGILVSGGSMGNFLGITAAVRDRAGWDVREEGLTHPDAARIRIYVTAEAHLSVARAVEACGLGARAIHWVRTDERGRMDIGDLRAGIAQDREAGLKPLVVVGTAGATGTGVVDPLFDIATVCRENGLWFHADGAYGACAVISSLAPADLAGIRLADSLVLDPHKWLYLPMEVACILTRDPRALYEAFRRSADYYTYGQTLHLMPDGTEALPFRDQGMQTSRSLRALKVWLSLQHIGRSGYERMLTDDILLARHLYQLAEAAPALEAVTQHLSISTFRYRPPDLDPAAPGYERYLDELNRTLVPRLQTSGEAYMTPTVVNGRYVLRFCIVNFKTTRADIEALVDLVMELGQQVDAELRPGRLASLDQVR
jgi:aromatic-L-amino-acid/L-tryptophan decarboxylase